MPGPIVLPPGGDPVAISGSFPPWSQIFTIELKPGEPYVGRDDIEREVLLDAANRKVITAQQKYEMTRRRRQKKGS